MITNTVERVLRKEEETDKKYNDAKLRCDEIIKNAKTEARKICDKIINDAKKDAENIIKEAETEFDKMMREAKRTGKERQNEIQRDAPSKIAGAKEKVFDILF